MLSARSPAPRPSTRRWVPKRLLAPVDRHSVRIAMRACGARVSRAGGATHATGSATLTAPAGVRRMVSLRAQNPRTMHLSPQHGHHTLAQHAPKNGEGRSEVRIDLLVNGQARSASRTAEGMVQGDGPPSWGCSSRAAHLLFHFSCPRGFHGRAVSEIHQKNRLWGHARVPRAALTLQMTMYSIGLNRIGLCGSSCGTSQRPATSTPTRRR